MNAILVLEDGKTFQCRSFTGTGGVGAEIVFNTSMTGYQEILTDPSYLGQMVIMTYPMIGICGINFDDFESGVVHLSALLIREYQSYPSNYRSKLTLAKFLRQNQIVGVDRIDTRELVRHIRCFGSMRAYISTVDFDVFSLTRKVELVPKIGDLELVKKVTTTRGYAWYKNRKEMFKENISFNSEIWKFSKSKASIIVLDYGLKLSLLRCLSYYDFEIIVLPADTSFRTIRTISPNGIVLSSGPGDPSSIMQIVKIIRKLINTGIPIFGVCLGHQILSLALGATSYKLKFGHRGGNQPVKNLITGKVEMTSQNHGFAIDIGSLKNRDVEITHINLNDNTVEGIKHRKLPVFSIQYHPEASPGPRDAIHFFEQFRSTVDF